MTTRITAVVIGVLLLFGAGILFAQKAKGNADEQAILKLDVAWSAAAQSKDVEKTVSFYAEDGAAFPFNAPIASGKEHIREMWSHLMSLPGFALTFSSTTIVVAKSGDVAYDIGTFQLTLNDAQGTPKPTVGKYVVVWKKQADKQWKVAADIFNTDM